MSDKQSLTRATTKQHRAMPQLMRVRRAIINLVWMSATPGKCPQYRASYMRSKPSAQPGTTRHAGAQAKTKRCCCFVLGSANAFCGVVYNRQPVVTEWSYTGDDANPDYADCDEQTAGLQQANLCATKHLQHSRSQAFPHPKTFAKRHGFCCAAGGALSPVRLPSDAPMNHNMHT